MSLLFSIFKLFVSFLFGSDEPSASGSDDGSDTYSERQQWPQPRSTDLEVGLGYGPIRSYSERARHQHPTVSPAQQPRQKVVQPALPRRTEPEARLGRESVSTFQERVRQWKQQQERLTPIREAPWQQPQQRVVPPPHPSRQYSWQEASEYQSIFPPLGVVQPQQQRRPPPIVQQQRPPSPAIPAVQIWRPLSYSGEEEDDPSEYLLHLTDDDSAATLDDNSRHKSLRAKANIEGDAMSRCFQESKAAHSSGNRARAKDLSKQGKIHKVEMKRLHKEACDLVFQINNKKMKPNVVDLHGLYVKEAIQKTKEAIIGAQIRNDAQVRVIVGKGIHSEGDPKLRPAIEKLVIKYGLVAAEARRNSGVLIITLKERVAESTVSPRALKRKSKGKHSQRRVAQPQSAAREVNTSIRHTPYSPHERREALGQRGHGAGSMAPRLEVEIL
ncbi:hypothetical protein FRB94_013627 [Tulasnella sp. JGI-2019a]|nr:hypothetical protein FRB94_013627 [Tulasnella sp. JGI-2019a]KAG9026874.1 hypothetical protein FRB95_008360 [Tulasnella sp. JGI-2019a]